MKGIRVLLIHNYYQQPGGEDQVFKAEKAMLQEAGVEVIEHLAHNDELASMGPLKLAQVTLWNGHAYNQVRSLVRKHKPHVAHVHNTFPLLSPAIYHAIKAEGVPIVQTLHNYRLLCLNATLLREGQECVKCLGKSVPWPGVWHSCYRNRAASSVVASMLVMHRLLRTWKDKIDRFIVLTDYEYSVFVKGGLEPHKIKLKPNFVHPDPGPGDGQGGYALFVGRLSPEKGIGVLLEAWKNLDIPLKIAGDGPLGAVVAEAVKSMPQVEWLGRRPRQEIFPLMQKAAFLVFPSITYEGFPMTLVEAFATGLPVIGSNYGSMPQVIREDECGLLFEVGNAESLAKKAKWIWNKPDRLAEMRQQARLEFETRYSAKQNLQMLLGIYQEAAGPNWP
ncbi:MAG: glycosyltransferase family 4 protein [Meiothermus sp.]|uniref:glycosyltransferase family 4 protein n=1 Tax=Meiothermus sp. TaxID=1955249 RepID=UPI0025FDF52C|nr:glycosyltransferase family 4 protein [Meiothermus sp.]MCS7069153.1 glycosyltransferase family 4 protein [Meiothermus sp.]MDW8425829.1 glycosyltransferase family 4 protein [Meiothermus sp.]